MCADLASQQASPGNWPSDMAHQAFTADAVHDGSMRDGKVPSNPPGDAPRSAGLPLQAGGGPQAGQGPQAGVLHPAGMSAVDRLGREYPIEGLAAPPGVFSDAVQLSTLVRTVCGCLLCQRERLWFAPSAVDC